MDAQHGRPRFGDGGGVVAVPQLPPHRHVGQPVPVGGALGGQADRVLGGGDPGRVVPDGLVDADHRTLGVRAPGNEPELDALRRRQGQPEGDGPALDHGGRRPPAGRPVDQVEGTDAVVRPPPAPVVHGGGGLPVHGGSGGGQRGGHALVVAHASGTAHSGPGDRGQAGGSSPSPSPSSSGPSPHPSASSSVGRTGGSAHPVGVVHPALERGHGLGIVEGGVELLELVLVHDEGRLEGGVDLEVLVEGGIELLPIGEGLVPLLERLAPRGVVRTPRTVVHGTSSGGLGASSPIVRERARRAATILPGQREVGRMDAEIPGRGEPRCQTGRGRQGRPGGASDP